MNRRKKCWVIAILLFICLTTLIPQNSSTSSAATLKKWQTIKGKRYYFKNGQKLKGWQKIGRKWYRFSSRGVYLGVTRKKTIVLDPGHSSKMPSGFEPLGPGSGQWKTKDVIGTQGISTKVPEYQLTLTIAKQLKKELENRGYRVLMTRTTSHKAISCKSRADVANRAKADAFIRIHANGSSNSSVQGAMTICTTSQSPFVSKSLSAKSKRLSQSLLDAYVKATGFKKESVWETDSMSGNNWCQVPSTIIEMGYMTNPTEDRRMQSKRYQKKMVKGIADGVEAYFKK